MPSPLSLDSNHSSVHRAPLKHHLRWRPLSPAVPALEAVGPGSVEPIQTVYALRVEKGHMGDILNNSNCVSSETNHMFFFP